MPNESPEYNFPPPWQKEVERLKTENEALKDLIVSQDDNVHEQHARAEKEHARGNTDDLTGILNRRGLKEAFEELIKKPSSPEEGDLREIHREFTVVFLDLDNFKNVNTMYGHAEGDKVVKAAAEYLGGQVRANDKVERYGGEEFVLLLSHAEANDILRKLDGKKFTVEVSDQSGKPVVLEMSFSGGIKSFRPTWENFKEAVVVANQAMQVAKSTGKNKVLIAEETGEPTSSV